MQRTTLSPSSTRVLALFPLPSALSSRAPSRRAPPRLGWCGPCPVRAAQPAPPIGRPQAWWESWHGAMAGGLINLALSKMRHPQLKESTTNCPALPESPVQVCPKLADRNVRGARKVSRAQVSDSLVLFRWPCGRDFPFCLDRVSVCIPTGRGEGRARASEGARAAALQYRARSLSLTPTCLPPSPPAARCTQPVRPRQARAK